MNVFFKFDWIRYFLIGWFEARFDYMKRYCEDEIKLKHMGYDLLVEKIPYQISFEYEFEDS